MGKVVVEIIRPVNPLGVSFIKYLYGAAASQDRRIVEKHKKEFVELIRKIGEKISEIIGEGKLITGTVIIETGDFGKPERITVKNIKVWDVVKELKEEVSI